MTQLTACGMHWGEQVHEYEEIIQVVMESLAQHGVTRQEAETVVDDVVAAVQATTGRKPTLAELHCCVAAALNTVFND